MRSYSTARTRFLLIRAFLLVVSAVAVAGCGSGGESQQQERAAPPPLPVAVQVMEPQAVDVYAVYPGRVQGESEVQVLARIEGILLERHYNEGQIVEKGELLVTIDPRPFLATVEQREAQLAQARAELNQAQRVWERVSQLFEANAVSEAERDSSLSQLETAQAAVQLALANLESAEIDLSYTRVEAPLTGVTSLEEAEEGALLSPGTQLTTITQLDPVHVLFSVPEEDARMRERALTAMVEEDGLTRTATIILPNGEAFEQPGNVDFTQSTIDPSTGTVRLRAVFDNSDNNLVPGSFVRVRIRLETRADAFVVPDKSVMSGQQQAATVFVVTDDNVAESVPVDLGPVVANGRIIESGLEAGDRVVTVGLGRISDGAPVNIEPLEEVDTTEGAGPSPGDGDADDNAQAPTSDRDERDVSSADAQDG